MVLLMVQKSPTTTVWMYKTLQKNWINYQPQLVLFVYRISGCHPTWYLQNPPPQQIQQRSIPTSQLRVHHVAMIIMNVGMSHVCLLETSKKIGGVWRPQGVFGPKLCQENCLRKCGAGKVAYSSVESWMRFSLWNLSSKSLGG